MSEKGDLSDQGLEIEIKFLIEDIAELRERLIAAGARQIIPRTYELNVRFDDAGERLRYQGKLLRLRQDERARLTYKAEAERNEDSEVMIREEIEIIVDDFDRTGAILEHLGFKKMQSYEKYRETFALGKVEIVLDEMPFGDFIEIEGQEEAIRSAARALDLNWQRRILENYLSLMARLKSHYNLPFDDITFSNFSGKDVSLAQIMD